MKSRIPGVDLPGVDVVSHLNYVVRSLIPINFITEFAAKGSDIEPGNNIWKGGPIKPFPRTHRENRDIITRVISTRALDGLAVYSIILHVINIVREPEGGAGEESIFREERGRRNLSLVDSRAYGEHENCNYAKRTHANNSQQLGGGGGGATHVEAHHRHPIAANTGVRHAKRE